MKTKYLTIEKIKELDEDNDISDLIKTLIDDNVKKVVAVSWQTLDDGQLVNATFHIKPDMEKYTKWEKDRDAIMSLILENLHILKNISEISAFDNIIKNTRLLINKFITDNEFATKLFNVWVYYGGKLNILIDGDIIIVNTPEELLDVIVKYL